MGQPPAGCVTHFQFLSTYKVFQNAIVMITVCQNVDRANVHFITLKIVEKLNGKVIFNGGF